MTDHYNTLGVARNANPDEIKKAYRRLAAIHHPDKGGDTAMFQKIQTAYETLSDPQKKQQYDNPNPFNGMQGGPFGGGAFHFDFGGPGGFQFHQNGFDMHDIFGQMFGGQRQGGFRPQQPSYRTTLHVTLEQAYRGDEQILQLQTHSGSHTIKINIPRGVDNGQSMRYDNLIKDTILLVEFRVHQHRKFERQAQNLHSVVDISILDLIVGTSIKFETISGKTLDVTVPANSQPGSRLRIANEGMPTNYGFGDQFILINPVIPDKIDSRIIDAINQFK
jgi:DnaJ-class molecular chaperone